MKLMYSKLLTFSIFLVSFGLFFSQEGIRSNLYKGTIDKMPVTLYLQVEATGCGPQFYHGMYQYDKLSKWLYLEISDDEQSQLVMVEGGITGILSLKKSGKSLNGFWISPDGKKKLNVNLKEIPASEKTLETLNQKYQNVYYEMNAC